MPLTLHINVAISSFNLYFFPFSGFSKEIVRLTASKRFFCPLATFSHVGLSESSKSAINTFTSEFKALIIIFRSTGPVISTLLSRRSFGIGLTCHSDSLISLVSSRKSGRLPSSKDFCLFFLSSNKVLIFVSNFLCKFSTKLLASSEKIS